MASGGEEKLDDLVNVLASGIGTLTNPGKLENTFRSVLHSKILLEHDFQLYRLP